MRLFSALILLLGLSAPASAQIYSWRNGNGTLVLSDRPLDPSARALAVREAFTGTASPARRAEDAHYEELISRTAREHRVRPELVRAVIQVESGFQPWARSPKGAMGLMQLMPATAAELGVRNAFDVAENIRGGTAYLRTLLDRFGSEELALAAYNAGPEAVDRHGSRVPPYRETQEYVRLIGSHLTLRTRIGGQTVFKVVEEIDGREVPRYSNVQPSSSAQAIAVSTR